MLRNVIHLCVILILLPVFLLNAVAFGQTQVKPPPIASGSWTLVLLPDTQVYTDHAPGIFTMQTHWIAKNKDKFNIRYVISLGDITQRDSDREWLRAKEAISELDGKVPYVLIPGNHDYTPQHDPTGKTRLNKYFPVAWFRDWPTFGGSIRDDDLTSNYHLFSAGDVDWIILALEWAPRDETVKWANAILAKYPQRKAILVTHAYLYDDGTRYDFAKKGVSQEWNPHSYMPKLPINDGEELWQKLVRKNNVVLTLNGHVCHSGVGFLSSKNDEGEAVHQMLVDYQSRPLGGDGYLRILEFLPDRKTVRVKSYSPLWDKYLEDANNQFSFELAPCAVNEAIR